MPRLIFVFPETAFTLNSLFFRLFLLILFGGMVWVVNITWYKPFDIDHFFERVTWEYGQSHPETFTRIRPSGVFGFNGFSRYLDDLSDETAQAGQVWAQKNLAMLQSYRPADQTESQQASTKVLTWYFEEVELGKNFDRYGYPLNPIDGIHLALPNLMLRFHHIRNLQDAESYLTRLGGFEKKIEDAFRIMGLNSEQQGAWPCELKAKVRQQVDELVADQIVASALVNDFQTKIGQMVGAKSITLEAREELMAEANLVVYHSVYPAYLRLAKRLDSLECQQGAAVRDSLTQLGTVPQDPYYSYLLHWHAAIPVSILIDPEAIFAKGLRDVAGLEDSLQKVAGPLEHRGLPPLAWLRAQARRVDQSCADSLIQKVVFLEKNLVGLFETAQALRVNATDKQAFDSLACPMPEAFPLTLDPKVTQPATYELVFGQPSARPQEYLARAAQDIFPGYLYQKQVQVGLKQLPTFRRNIEFTAFTQGWRAYVLQLLAEEGFFDQPEDHLGLLHLQLVQASCLVADLGLHSQLWPRGQAFGYLQAHTALTDDEINYLIDRMQVYPAEATAWQGGLATLLHLRQQAKLALGSGFDLREFHDAILQTGNVPLPVLSQAVANYIAHVKREMAGGK